jgi:hypothetical protein
MDQLRNIIRPTDATGQTLEMDLLWADPVDNLSGFQKNMRGASYGFGADVLATLCEELSIDMVARGHQVVQDGYEFFGNRKLVTIFSAPHYVSLSLLFILAFLVWTIRQRCWDAYGQRKFGLFFSNSSAANGKIN